MEYHDINLLAYFIKSLAPFFTLSSTAILGLLWNVYLIIYILYITMDPISITSMHSSTLSMSP